MPPCDRGALTLPAPPFLANIRRRFARFAVLFWAHVPPIMRGTMTKCLCLGFVFSALLCAQDPSSRVDTLFSSFGSRSPGCAFGVVYGSNVYAKAYGMADLEHDVPITTATPFYMASV